MIASDQRTSSHPHLMLSPCPVTVLIPWEDDNDDQYRYGICNLRPKRKHNLHPKDYIINNSQTPTKLVSFASSGHSSSTVPCPRSLGSTSHPVRHCAVCLSSCRVDRRRRVDTREQQKIIMNGITFTYI